MCVDSLDNALSTPSDTIQYPTADQASSQPSIASVPGLPVQDSTASGPDSTASGPGTSYSIEDMLRDQQTPAPAPVAPKVSDPIDSLLGPVGDDSQGSLQPSPSSSMGSGADAMAALLNGDVGTVGSKPEEDDSHGFSMKHVDLPESARDIVSGIIESFMHKVHLEPGEKKCLEDSVASFGSDVVAMGRDIVNAVKGFLKPSGKGLSANSAGLASLMPLAMDGITRITDLVTVSTSLVKKCVQGDALALLNQTAHNLINFSYVERRLIVNGVNIVEALAQSILDFEDHNFRGFGEQIGLSLRKILLSTATNGIQLPEGMPEDKLIADASEGIFGGFFAPGVHFIVKDKADPNVDIDLDLHACIAGNHAFFRDVWESLWTLFAMMAANKGQHMNPMEPQSGGQPKWMNELLMAVMRLPMAFTKCGVDPEMESMMLEAFKTFKELSVTFTFPDDKIKADTATEKVALAVEAFTHWKFKEFGYELGKLFRELLLLALPKKYSVDDTGRLRRQLLNEVEVYKKKEQQSNSGRATLVVGSVSLVLLMSLVALKRLRLPVPCQHVYRDVEAVDNEEIETLE